MLLVLPSRVYCGMTNRNFCRGIDGMRRISQLGQLDPKRLGVILGHCSRSRQATKKSIGEIGRRVAHRNVCLEGSVRCGRRACGAVRARYRGAGTSPHLWSQVMTEDLATKS